MEHVQILIVITCILLLNQGQIEAEILLMLCLILRRLILRNQVTLLASEHCRQQRRRADSIDFVVEDRFSNMTATLVSISSTVKHPCTYPAGILFYVETC